MHSTFYNKMAVVTRSSRKFDSLLLTLATLILSTVICQSKIITVNGVKPKVYRVSSKDMYRHLRQQMPSQIKAQPSPQLPNHNNAHSQYETLSVVMETKHARQNRFIQVQSPQSIYPPDNVLQIEYECLPGEVAGVELEMWTVYGQRLQSVTDHWTCSEHSRNARKVFQTLQLPDGVVYQPDYLNRDVQIIEKMELSAWILRSDLFRSRKGGYFELADAKAKYNVQVRSMYARPRKKHHSVGCLTWEAEIMLKYSQRWNSILQCNTEQEVIDLMTFPLACHSSFYGLTRDIPPYQEPGLALQMDTNINNPKFTISAFIYLTEYCKHSLCSFIHRKTKYTNLYASPLIFLKKDGQVFIQIEDAKKSHSSFNNDIKLPLKEWIQMVYVQNGRKWSVQFYPQSAPKTKPLVGRSMFASDVRYNETDAFYHLGGSSAVRSFSGFMLGAKLWRHQALDPLTVLTPIDELNYTRDISKYYKDCDRLHVSMETVFANFQLKHQNKVEKTSCPNPNPLLANNIATKVQPRSQPTCNLWQQPAPRRQLKLWKLLQQSASVNNSYATTHEWIGHHLYQHALETLQMEGLRGINTMIPLLRQASCYGNVDATSFLATAYSAGLGVPTNASKALIYWLVAAQKGSRFATTALANKHHQGLDEVPLDLDYAFKYYYHVAMETVADRTKHKVSDISFEAVRLTDESQLQTQTGVTGDYFKWLKHQAKQGVADAQINLARMYYHGTAGVERDMEAAAELYRLHAEQNPWDPIAQYDYAVLHLRSSIAEHLFWGSHGVERNMEAAVTYYAETAVTHPMNKIALYDYGIVLIRGQGIEKDEKKGLEYLNKSAELGHGPAYTALGWYKTNFEHNHTAAAYYYEKGDELGHRDAAHNLGYLYLMGRYPGKPLDRMKGFEYFLKAAKADHWDSGAKVAELYNQGNEEMPRDTVMAAAWARYVAEKNRDIAWALRRGLDAYLKSSWSESLVYYAMAAETGLEVGQFNLAYLCEENYDGVAELYMDRDCAWKYWNLAAASSYPHLSSILRVADYYWYGYRNVSDEEKAVQYYTQAAETREPHALFNLANLIENGVKVKEEVLERILVSSRYSQGNKTLLAVMELYRMCRDTSEDAYFPCGLALLNLQLKQMWKEHNFSIQVAGAFVGGLLTTLAVAAFLGYLGSSNTPKNVNNNNSNTSSDEESLVDQQHVGEATQEQLLNVAARDETSSINAAGHHDCRESGQLPTTRESLLNVAAMSTTMSKTQSNSSSPQCNGNSDACTAASKDDGESELPLTASKSLYVAATRSSDMSAVTEPLSPKEGSTKQATSD